MFHVEPLSQMRSNFKATSTSKATVELGKSIQTVRTGRSDEVSSPHLP